jgi:hypothetical protein
MAVGWRGAVSDDGLLVIRSATTVINLLCVIKHKSAQKQTSISSHRMHASISRSSAATCEKLWALRTCASKPHDDLNTVRTLCLHIKAIVGVGMCVLYVKYGTKSAPPLRAKTSN